MARRTKEEAEQTKAAILASALELFYEKGFARTTFDEIAKRINLTKGAVYWHFRNKADLLAELMKQKFTDKEKPWLPMSDKNVIEGIRESFRRSAELIEADAEYRKFLFFVIFHMEWSEIIVNHIMKQLREIVDYPWFQLKERLTFAQKSGEISPNVNIDDLTTLLSCTWRGLVDAYVSKRFPMSLQVAVLQGFDLIIDGLKVEKK